MTREGVSDIINKLSREGARSLKIEQQDDHGSRDAFVGKDSENSFEENKETLTSKRARTERFKEQTLIGKSERADYTRNQRV